MSWTVFLNRRAVLDLKSPPSPFYLLLEFFENIFMRFQLNDLKLKGGRKNSNYPQGP